MNKEIPILFERKQDCCACGACLNICPRKAISMQEDEYGFLYPQIDADSCVRCGKCKSVCAFQNTEITNYPLTAYAAVAKSPKVVECSASGGVFGALAQNVIEDGGMVFGAEMLSDFTVAHTSIDAIGELCRLQGSKYVQSSIDAAYHEAAEKLRSGVSVFFSGTPCQIAGLYGYLGGDRDNLVTADIVCHGVPSNRMFKDYIKSLGNNVREFKFRDKRIGWGINGSAMVDGKKIKVWQSASSYLFYFTKGWIYRENCYCCKYASENRPADITLGDYWGIEKQHPEYLGAGGWDEQRGISLVIVNTEKGKKFLSDVAGVIQLKESTFDKVSAGNGQLRVPSKKGKRDEIIELYRENGWEALEEWFDRNIGWRKYSSYLKRLIPAGIKRMLKAVR